MVVVEVEEIGGAGGDVEEEGDLITEMTIITTMLRFSVRKF